MKFKKMRFSLINHLRNSLVIGFLLLSIIANAQTTVSSLAELKPYLSQSNVDVKLAPGTYSITAEDVTNGLFDNSTTILNITSNVLFLFSGDGSTYDFTDVTINVETAVFNAYDSGQLFQVQVTGSENVIKNLTLVDIGSVHDDPKNGATNVVMDGRENRIEGFHITVKGSYPYGYGDAFGKGGTGNVISHNKHSAFLVRGLQNHVKNCTIIHRSYGHALFMQAADQALIEGCYIEGEVRSTDDMLAEKGTGSPADNVDFMTAWGYTLPAGYTMSLGEEGIRAYNGGETVVDGVEYSRGTSNPTVLNCTIKHLRTGVNLPHATGTKYVEGCVAIGCEQGFAVGSGDIVDCSADCAFGPVYKSTYAADKNVTADITILPAIDAYHNGSKCVAYIGGSSKDITLRNSESVLSKDYKVQMGGDFKGVGLLYGNAASQNNHAASNIEIYNYTGYELDLPSTSSSITGESCGTITDEGTSNSITSTSCTTECFYQLGSTPSAGITSGLEYTYYEGTWDELPNFDTITSVKSGIIDEIELSNAEVDDNYGFKFKSYIYIPTKGEYTFYTTSDDESKLFIDGILIVDNKGIGDTPEVARQICLEAGYHHFRCDFYKATGNETLSVMYESATISKTTISEFFYEVSSTNMALNGTATQSSTAYSGPPELAIDGNTDGNFGNGSVTHTAHDDAIKWWQVDLGSEKYIEEIVIYNRTGSNYGEYLNNYTVEILDGVGSVVYSEFFADYPNPSKNINVDGLIGQVIKISKTSDRGMTLAEVQVFGKDVGKQQQVITFEALPTKELGDADFAPGASASSGLNVSYSSSDLSVATIVDGNIHIVGVGTTTIVASQPGDENYFSAAMVSQELEVSGSTSLDNNNSDIISVYPNPTTGILYFNNVGKASIELYNTQGSSVFKTQLCDDNQSINLGDLPKGVYILNIYMDESTLSEKIMLK